MKTSHKESSLVIWGVIGGAFLILFLSFLFSLIALILSNRTPNLINDNPIWCIEMNNLLFKNVNNLGNNNMTAYGFAKIDGLTFSYEFLIGGNTGQLESMYLRGPLTDANPQVSTIFLPPDGTSFDITILGISTIRGSLEITTLQKEVILSDPQYFYFIITTNQFTNGAILGFIGNSCF